MNDCRFASAFSALEQWLTPHLHADEQFTLWYAAEDSQFVRFNHAKVRQAYPVLQIELTLRLIRDERHSTRHLNLTGDIEQDCLLLADTLTQLRAVLDVLPADPYLLLNTDSWVLERRVPGNSPPLHEVIEQICGLSEGLDMVGIYAGGSLYRGFSDSWGARGWHACSNNVFDWSLFDPSGEAVKSTYAAANWDVLALAQAFAQARVQLKHLSTPHIALKPGQYRAYLAPAAVNELLGMLAWGAFSAKAFANGQSPFQHLLSGTQHLSPLINLRNEPSTGLEPDFGPEGNQTRDLDLIAHGTLVGQLINARSAAEYGLTANGADTHEIPHSLSMAPGELPSADVLHALGTGLYISNVWYLNYSDESAARLTGMTRFATFWVENGQIVAPVQTMRFDDSVYNMLGANLLALTRERALFTSTSTYERRDLGSCLLPGALLGALTLTL
ncbi:TldD/PmbA family protein [Pseudomonas lundensis]|uniref:TldD/PmbA family protein n=1 Tax=Pseudomonas lundensis TaxID=86185 RepID=UPI00064198BE|nr:metallopeptidase TldD-related protein [Pseudomonas lundensis]